MSNLLKDVEELYKLWKWTIESNELSRPVNLATNLAKLMRMHVAHLRFMAKANAVLQKRQQHASPLSSTSSWFALCTSTLIYTIFNSDYSRYNCWNEIGKIINSLQSTDLTSFRKETETTIKFIFWSVAPWQASERMLLWRQMDNWIAERILERPSTTSAVSIVEHVFPSLDVSGLLVASVFRGFILLSIEEVQQNVQHHVLQKSQARPNCLLYSLLLESIDSEYSKASETWSGSETSLLFSTRSGLALLFNSIFLHIHEDTQKQSKAFRVFAIWLMVLPLVADAHMMGLVKSHIFNWSNSEILAKSVARIRSISLALEAADANDREVFVVKHWLHDIVSTSTACIQLSNLCPEKFAALSPPRPQRNVENVLSTSNERWTVQQLIAIVSYLSNGVAMQMMSEKSCRYPALTHTSDLWHLPLPIESEEWSLFEFPRTISLDEPRFYKIVQVYTELQSETGLMNPGGGTSELFCKRILLCVLMFNIVAYRQMSRQDQSFVTTADLSYFCAQIVYMLKSFDFANCGFPHEVNAPLNKSIDRMPLMMNLERWPESTSEDSSISIIQQLFHTKACLHPADLWTEYLELLLVTFKLAYQDFSSMEAKVYSDELVNDLMEQLTLACLPHRRRQPLPVFNACSETFVDLQQILRRQLISRRREANKELSLGSAKLTKESSVDFSSTENQNNNSGPGFQMITLEPSRKSSSDNSKDALSSSNLTFGGSTHMQNYEEVFEIPFRSVDWMSPLLFLYSSNLEKVCFGRFAQKYGCVESSTKFSVPVLFPVVADRLIRQCMELYAEKGRSLAISRILASLHCDFPHPFLFGAQVALTLLAAVGETMQRLGRKFDRKLASFKKVLTPFENEDIFDDEPPEFVAGTKRHRDGSDVKVSTDERPPPPAPPPRDETRKKGIVVSGSKAQTKHQNFFKFSNISKRINELLTVASLLCNRIDDLINEATTKAHLLTAEEITAWGILVENGTTTGVTTLNFLAELISREIIKYKVLLPKYYLENAYVTTLLVDQTEKITLHLLSIIATLTTSSQTLAMRLGNVEGETLKMHQRQFRRTSQAVVQLIRLWRSVLRKHDILRDESDTDEIQETPPHDGGSLKRRKCVGSEDGSTNWSTAAPFETVNDEDIEDDLGSFVDEDEMQDAGFLDYDEAGNPVLADSMREFLWSMFHDTRLLQNDNNDPKPSHFA